MNVHGRISKVIFGEICFGEFLLLISLERRKFVKLNETLNKMLTDNGILFTLNAVGKREKGFPNEKEK